MLMIDSNVVFKYCNTLHLEDRDLKCNAKKECEVAYKSFTMSTIILTERWAKIEENKSGCINSSWSKNAFTSCAGRTDAAWNLERGRNGHHPYQLRRTK